MKNYVEAPTIPSVEQQLSSDMARWMFESHCWNKGYKQCIWCGWMPCQPSILSEETVHLCPENPKVKKLISEKKK